MKRLFTIGAVVLLGPIAGVSHAQASENIDQAWVTQNLTSMPLAFTQNMGQWDERALFRADAGGATMWITTEGVYYQFSRRVPKDENPPQAVGHPDFRGRQASSSAPDDVTLSLSKGDMLREGFDHAPDSIETMVITARFVGANPNQSDGDGDDYGNLCDKPSFKTYDRERFLV